MKNNLDRLLLSFLRSLDRLPQPLPGLVVVTIIAALIGLPFFALESMGFMSTGGDANTEERCDYYATNC
jgi:hypothetical protein